MSAPHVVIAAGGTGGHMFPAQSLAEVMLARGWRVTLSTDARGAQYTSGFPDAVQIKQVSSATFARGGALAKVVVPVRIAGGILRAAADFFNERPTVVAGFGGYPSIPALAAAWALRVPRLIHEQNGVLGRVNQLFARRVNRVACGMWPTALPAGITGEHVGNPVREAVLRYAAEPYPAESGPIRILAFGGSQGARVISDIVPSALAQLPESLRARLDVSHQARPEDHDAVTATYAKASIAAHVVPFMSDLPERMAASHLVISRSGASSVADISVIGRPSILIPFASAIRDEQTANARGLVNAEAAIMMPESALDPAALAEHVMMMLTTPGTGQRMSENAVAHSIPDAADRLATLVEHLAEKKQ